MPIEVQDPTKTTLIDLDGGSAPVYVAEAKSVQPTFQFTVAGYSKANPGVVNVVGHGLNTANAVIISGATGSWAALNGRQIVTRVDADHFSIAVDTSGYSGSFDGVITTTAPRMSSAIWKIAKNYYDGSSNLLRSSFAAGAAPNQIYDNRASLEYN